MHTKTGMAQNMPIKNEIHILQFQKLLTANRKKSSFVTLNLEV